MWSDELESLRIETREFNDLLATELSGAPGVEVLGAAKVRELRAKGKVPSPRR